MFVLDLVVSSVCVQSKYSCPSRHCNDTSGGFNISPVMASRVFFFFFLTISPRWFQVIPATWNLTRGCHYTYLAWNVFMWICWLTTKHVDPGYLPIDSGSYIQTIRQVERYKRPLECFIVLNFVLNEVHKKKKISVYDLMIVLECS